MKKTLFIVFISITSFAQKLSPEAKFGLITVSPGSASDEVYQVWGHTVYHLNDPKNGINECYDYGTFDFNKEGFYIKFLKGTLPYQMAIYDFNAFVNHYRDNEKRSVDERILNLDENQKQRLFEFLKNNYLPQNREYNYRFFYYNCSSRLRDILGKICGNEVVFDEKLHADSTYRQWVTQYSDKKMPWAEFGMNLAIGLPSDQKTGYNGAMFLPNNLADAFDKAKIKHGGKFENLTLEKIELVNLEPLTEASQGIFKPIITFWFFCLAIVLTTIYQIKNNKHRIVFDKLLFTTIGVFGWFLFFLSFFTDHGVTENNLNLIWACPLLFPLALYLKPKKQLLDAFFMFYAIAMLLFLISYYFLPQGFPQGLWPLVLALLVRVIFVLYTKKTLTSLNKTE